MIKKISIPAIVILCFSIVSFVNGSDQIKYFTSDLIINNVKEQIINQYDFVSPENISVNIKNQEIFKNRPVNATYFSIEYPYDGTLLGKRLFSVVFYNSKYDVLEIQKIAIATSAEALVYTVTRKVKSNTVLTKSDIKQKLAPVNLISDSFTISLEDILSQQISRTISAGTAISSKWLEPIPTIREGEYVTAIIAKKGFQIEVPAQALEKGMTGELIRIKTHLSDKIIRGEISHEKSVIINPI
tara:strand:- start:11769 stop:12497 length:729 start_codon:yes stop_codon:yes gene_type:complete